MVNLLSFSRWVIYSCVTLLWFTAGLTAGETLTQVPSPGEGGFKTPDGFQVERLFTVPKEKLGSWVAIGFDNKGRLIASDQGKEGLCRITPPPVGSNEPTKVERLDLRITSAQGILYAFDSLYLSVNGGPGSGLYRARDTNGDDQYDEKTILAQVGIHITFLFSAMAIAAADRIMPSLAGKDAHV